MLAIMEWGLFPGDRRMSNFYPYNGVQGIDSHRKDFITLQSYLFMEVEEVLQ